MFYIQGGKVKLTVVSQQGREAVIAILEQGSFLGESCLAGQPVRTETATALEASSIVRINKDAMLHVLHKEPTFADAVYVLSAGSLDAHPRGFGGSALQFQREAAGADAPAAGPLWERRQAGTGDREGQSGNCSPR